MNRYFTTKNNSQDTKETEASSFIRTMKSPDEWDSLTEKKVPVLV